MELFSRVLVGGFLATGALVLSALLHRSPISGGLRGADRTHGPV